jgi:hypothetical protein
MKSIQKLALDNIVKNWVEPLEGDQCWANTQCTNAEVDITFKKYGIFKVAYK